MNKMIIKDEVQWLMEAISEQIAIINSPEDKIPQIEIDILLDNVRKLYTALNNLSRINNQVTVQPFVRHEREPVPEIPVPEQRFPAQPDMEPAAAVNISYTPPVVATVTNPVQSPAPEQGPVVQSEGATSDELFPGMEFTLGARLKEAREKAFPPKSGPEGLKNSISINDKFLIINELFDGNLKDYNENIDQLAACTDLKSAFSILDKLRESNRWETDGKGFKRLRELVEKQHA